MLLMVLVFVFNIIYLELQTTCAIVGTFAPTTAGVGVAGHREAPLGVDQSSLDPVPWSSTEGVCFRSWTSTSDS